MSVKKSVRIELNCFLYFNYFEFEYLENLGSLRSDLEEDMLAGGGSKKKEIGGELIDTTEILERHFQIIIKF